MKEIESSPQADQSPKPNIESLLGLAEDIEFRDVVARELEEGLGKGLSAYDIQKRQAVLAEHDVDLPPAVVPEQRLMTKLTEEDWGVIRASDNPLFTLYGATNYHNQVDETEFVSSYNNMRRHEDPRVGYKGMENRAVIRSLPLVHGLTANAFVQLTQGGTMQSNKTRFKESGVDALTFHSTKVGATNLQDRELGLDRYVFFDYGRPAVNHQRQAEITLSIDPSVMRQDGVFMTEQDMADTPSLKRYMDGLVSPEYFEETALLRIHNSIAEYQETHSGRRARYNTLSDWLTGKDGDRNADGYPMFSTYEVKTPDPPGIPIDAIRKVIVRDRETFEELQQTLGDQFELIYEPDLRAGGGRIRMPDGDPRDDPIDPGNYDLLQIPGEFEHQMEEIIEADFQKRVATLARLSEEDKEQAVVVFGETEPNKINGRDIRKRIDVRTNPYCYNDRAIATYDSMDALHADVQAVLYDELSTTTNAGQPAWFFDPLYTQHKRIATPSETCVVVTVERSKQDPKITRIVDARAFSL